MNHQRPIVSSTHDPKQKKVDHVPQQMEKSGVNKHGRNVGVPGGFGRNEPKMSDYPDIRLFPGLEKVDERSQINGDIKPDQSECDYRETLRPVLDPNRQEDNHN